MELLLALVMMGVYFLAFWFGYIMGINEPCMREHAPDDEAF